MTVAIRPTTENDIDAVYALSCAVHLTTFYQELVPDEGRIAFIERYTPNERGRLDYQERYRRNITDPSWFMWVAEDEGVVRGYTNARQIDGILKLKGLFVDTAAQGRGLGKLLFDTSCSVARPNQPIVLDVIATNRRAIEMYRRAGFKETHFTPEPFYGARMIRMQKY